MSFSIDHAIEFLLNSAEQLAGWSGDLTAWLASNPTAQFVTAVLSICIGYDSIKRAGRLSWDSLQAKRFALFWLSRKMVSRLGLWSFIPVFWMGILFSVVFDVILLPIELVCCFGLSFSIRQKLSEMALKVKNWRKKNGGEEDLFIDAMADIAGPPPDQANEEPSEKKVPPLHANVELTTIVENYPNGLPRYQGEVLVRPDGSQIRHGQYSEYHETSRLKKSCRYNNGTIVPETLKRWDETGKPIN